MGIKFGKKSISLSLVFIFIACFMPTITFASDTTTVFVNGVKINEAIDKTLYLGNGTAKYDETTNTVTLTDATINGNVKAIGI